jgi:hypothetical protein
MTGEPLFDYATARDAALATVERNAGPTFKDRASECILTYLSTRVWATGEELTDACKAQGIVAHDDRAMGPVLMSLSRRKLIEKCGVAIRKRGHGTSGGNLWRLKQT